MPRPARLAVAAALHLALVVGLFLALFDRPGSDDYAGWVLVVGALALPAFGVVAGARERLGPLAAVALGVPASLCLACVVLLMLTPMYVMSGNGLVLLAGVLLVAPAVTIASAAILVRRLAGMAPRVAARRVVAIVALSGAAATLAGAPVWWGFWDPSPHDLGTGVVVFLLGALPLGWSVGPALALLVAREPAR